MKIWQLGCALFALAIILCGVASAAAETIREIVDSELAGWPDSDRERVCAALSERAILDRVSKEDIAAYLGAVAKAHGTTPESTAEGAGVVVATIEACRELPNRTSAEETDYQSQIDEAFTVGEVWLNAHDSWLPKGVTTRSLGAFKTALATAQRNPLNLGFQEALPTVIQANILARWREDLDKLDAPGESAFRREFKIMLLNEDRTPSWEWQQNEKAASDATSGILRRYFELRNEFAVAQLPKFTAVKSARVAAREALEREKPAAAPELQPSGIGAHEDLLEQDVLWLTKAALDGQAPFTPHNLGDGTFSLGAPESGSDAAYQQQVVLKYRKTNRGTSGGESGTVHELQSILLSNRDRKRFEILARNPSMAQPAVFFEPIGWTLIREADNLAWLPGSQGVSLGVFRTKPIDLDGPVIDCGFTEWGLSRKTNYSLHNLAHVASGVLVAGDSSKPVPQLTANWSGRAPWFYMSRIERVAYTFKDSGETRVLDHAQLVDAATGEVAATVSWRDARQIEGGPRYYGEVVVEIEPVALKGLWRSDREPSDTSVVAPKRSIVYRFSEAQVGEKKDVVPVYFAVRGADEAPLVELIFEAPEAMREPTEISPDPLSTLPVPQSNAALAFYSIFKDYSFRYLNLSTKAKREEVGDWLEKFSRVRDKAIAEDDLMLALKCQEKICGSAIFNRAQYPAWKSEVFRALDMLESVSDRDVFWNSMASIIQRVYSAADAQLASEVDNRVAEIVAKVYGTAEALGRGQAYGFVNALPCFSAVEAKSLDRNLLIPAALGKASALAFVAKYVRNQPSPMEITSCEAYLDAARDTLKRAETSLKSSDPEEWRSLAEHSRKEIEEASNYLKDSHSAKVAR